MWKFLRATYIQRLPWISNWGTSPGSIFSTTAVAAAVPAAETLNAATIAATKGAGAPT